MGAVCLTSVGALSAIPWLALSAVLMAASFAPWNLWPVGFVALAPVFHLLERTPGPGWRQVVAWGLLWAVCFDALACPWLVGTARTFLDLPLSLAAGVALLYSLATSSNFVVFLALATLWQKRRGAAGKRVLAWTTAWGLAQSVGWELVPWYGANLVGGDLAFLQIADLVGVQGASLVWFLANLSLYESGCCLARRRPLPAGAGWGLALLVAAHLYGSAAMVYWEARLQEWPVRSVGLVQGNVPVPARAGTAAAAAASMTRETLALARSAVAEGRPLALAIWPESSVPAHPRRSSELIDLAGSVARTGDLELLLQGASVFPSGRYANMAWLLDRGGDVTGSYAKRILVPVGEYLPPVLGRASFAPGDRFDLMPSQAGRVLPLVCYEAIMPDHCWRFSRATGGRAQLLVNLTSDAWFGASSASRQHLELARMRAVELRLPLVRAANTGISAWVDPLGRVHGATGLGVEAEEIYEVPVPPRSGSPYARWGPWPYYAFLASSLFLWMPLAARRR